nr:hypothetical protein [uncultured Sphingomonas sp.]
MLTNSLTMIVAAAVGTAPPAAEPKASPPLTIDLLAMAKEKEGCRKSDPDDGSVLVCGRRDEDRYRIDPNMLAVLRHKNAATPRPQGQRTTLNTRQCDPVGQFGCLPGPAINLFAVAGVIVRLARGESVASIAKTQPDEYDYYRTVTSVDTPEGE